MFRYAIIVMSLTKLLKKINLPTILTLACTNAFNTLKIIITTPVLIPSDWDKDFHIYVNVSNVSIRSNLSQKDKKGKNHQIYSASH